MANIVTIKFLDKGPRNVVIAVFLKSDGVTGELANVTLIDPVVDLGLKPTARLNLRKIQYNIAGFDANLAFASGDVVPNYKWALVEGANNPEDFSAIGGLVDDSGINGTGKLQINTVGFTSSTDFGSLILWLIRNDS